MENLSRFLLELVPIRAVQELKEMSDQMERTCREILHQKRHPRRSDSVASGKAMESGSDSDLDGYPGRPTQELPHETEGPLCGDGDERDIMSILRKRGRPKLFL